MTSVSTSSETEQETTANGPPPDAEKPPAERAQTTAAQTATHRHGEAPVPGQVRILLRQPALRQIEGHGNSDLEREVGGVLLGHVRHGKGHSLVDIQAALPAQSDDHGPVHFTFNADVWSGIHRDRETRYPKLEIVGWFHTHPDLGVFYSADDVIVHSAAFVMPWHVGLVVDPIRGEGCFFGWHKQAERETELVPLTGYDELLEEQANSAASWRFVHAAVWHNGGYQRQEASPASDSEVYAPPNPYPTLPEISPWWGVFLGGLSLLISLLLLADRLLASGS